MNFMDGMRDTRYGHAWLCVAATQGPLKIQVALSSLTCSTMGCELLAHGTCLLEHLTNLLSHLACRRQCQGMGGQNRVGEWVKGGCYSVVLLAKPRPLWHASVTAQKRLMHSVSWWPCGQCSGTYVRTYMYTWHIAVNPPSATV